VFTTSGTYPWSFVTQIFHNGQPSHSVDRTIFEVMTSTLPKGTLGSVASLSAATLYQGNLDRNHELWNIVSSERYILHMQVLLECCQKYTVHLFFYNYIYFQLDLISFHCVEDIIVYILDISNKQS
jgi:hypothetical protein